mgnify:CR=1 FL=1
MNTYRDRMKKELCLQPMPRSITSLWQTNQLFKTRMKETFRDFKSKSHRTPLIKTAMVDTQMTAKKKTLLTHINAEDQPPGKINNKKTIVPPLSNYMLPRLSANAKPKT